ncbi:hypothetical protein EmuJ_000943100 [Echinococcus multilocularis]|uniref:Uncharacterized protein n=1 Tax=Echinococcus multilocularis TaxID=6211 RepID=A0A068YHQ5_ECHMU|nr:hypothetical protein EmuJ_000943100 [Echinococcus multilocularis]
MSHGRVDGWAEGQTHTCTHAHTRDASTSSAVDVRVCACSYGQADASERGRGWLSEEQRQWEICEIACRCHMSTRDLLRPSFIIQIHSTYFTSITKALNVYYKGNARRYPFMSKLNVRKE